MLEALSVAFQAEMATNQEMHFQSNFVDKSFQAALLPINLFQYTSFLSKYTIRNNFIYSKGYVYHIFSFFFICLVIQTHYFSSSVDVVINEPLTFEGSSITFSLIFNFVFFSCDCILLFLSNIYSSKFAVQLVVRVQKVTSGFRGFSNLLSNNNNFETWKRKNWIYVGATYFLYVIVAFMLTISFKSESKTESLSRFALVLLAVLYYDVNIICAFRYVKLCEDCLSLWISNVRFYSKQFKNNDNEIDKRKAKYYIKGLLDAYLDILNSFDMIKKIFQLPILLQIFDGFAHGLIYTQLFIEIGKRDYNINTPENSSQSSQTIAESFVFGWIIKNFIVLSFCIKGCEEFYITINKVERNCLVILGHHEHPELKKLYKNVLRINRSKFSKMTACGVITIDATLPLKFFEQWVIYVIVILQFAFD